MSEERDPRTVLEDGVDEVTRVVEGVAGLLLGRVSGTEPDDGGAPVISEDVDRAIQDLGSAVGGVLLAAGDHLQRTAGAEADQGGGDDDTPLVHGARSLGKGLSALAADVLDSLQQAAAPAEETAPEEADPE